MEQDEINQNLVNHLYGAAANYVECLIKNLPDDNKLAIMYAISRGGRMLVTIGLNDGGARINAALQAEDGKIYRVDDDVKLVDTYRRLAN